MMNGMSLRGAFRAAWLTLWDKPGSLKSYEVASNLERAHGSRGPYARITPRQSLVKSVTWRFVAALDTFAVSYLITGRFTSASSIVGAEVLTKTVIYYGHERAWSHVRWGTSPVPYHSKLHVCRRSIWKLLRTRTNRRQIAVARLKRRSAEIYGTGDSRSLAQFGAGPTVLIRKRIYFGAAFIWIALFLVHWGVWTVRTLGRGWPTSIAFFLAIACIAIIAALLLGSTIRANGQIDP
jgi:uncharacterized membrane protein